MNVRTSVMRSFAVVALSALAFAACDKKDPVAPPPAVIVTVTPQTATLTVGQTLPVGASVQNATNTAVNWSSSNAAVASVSAAGVITAVAPGAALITAESAQDPNAKGFVSVTVTPAAPPTLTLAPTTASVVVGQTVQLVAAVTGSANTGVTFTTSAAGIASVDASGLVTGVAAGTAIITAIAAADQNVRATAVITVTPAAPPPSVSIQNVAPLGANNAATGSITATVNVSADVSHDVRVVSVRLGDTEVCRQTFSQPLGTTQGVAVINCQINTAALNPAGEPVFPNGAYELTAVALNADGDEVAEASFGNVNLTNANVLNYTATTVGVRGSGSAPSGGIIWREGNVVVEVQPAMFSGAVGSMQICIEAVDGPQTNASCRAATQDGNTWSATFPRSAAVGGNTNGSAGITTSSLEVSITSLTDQNTTGPSVAATHAFPLDQVSPAAPTLELQNVDPANIWVNGSYMFNANNVVTAAAVDVAPGVGGITYTFHAIANTLANAALDDDEIVDEGIQVTSGADLNDTDTNQGYIMVVRSRDALGNFVDERLPLPFGVDRTNPTIAFTSGSPAAMRINPVAVFAFNVQDVQGATGLPSGFVNNPLWVTIVRYTSTPAQTRCINANTGAVTNVPSAGCAAVNLTSALNDLDLPNLPGLADGYYEISVFARDRARNSSNVVTRIVLVDGDEPVVTVNSFGVAGSQISLNTTITDNVDIRGWDERVQFAGAPQEDLPISALNAVGTFGPTGRVGSTDANPTITIWRSLTVVTDVGGALAGAATFQASGAGVGAFDIARNFGVSYVLSAQAGGGPQADQTHFVITINNATICNGLTPISNFGDDPGVSCGTSPSIPTTRTISAEVVGPSGTFLNPFNQVHVYGEDPQGNVWRLGAATVGSAFERGGPPSTERVFPYTATLNASGLQGGVWQVFLVGYNSTTRDAVRSNALAVTVQGARGQP